tara:strand:+ start:56 stop:157 length:102 start_codon:yes stop_codon:yes gene_type:complete
MSTTKTDNKEKPKSIPVAPAEGTDQSAPKKANG